MGKLSLIPLVYDDQSAASRLNRFGGKVPFVDTGYGRTCGPPDVQLLANDD
jgi:hypothetical protein